MGALVLAIEDEGEMRALQGKAGAIGEGGCLVHTPPFSPDRRGGRQTGFLQR
jgi:hypothetical protein